MKPKRVKNELNVSVYIFLIKAQKLKSIFISHFRVQFLSIFQKLNSFNLLYRKIEARNRVVDIVRLSQKKLFHLRKFKFHFLIFDLIFDWSSNLKALKKNELSTSNAQSFFELVSTQLLHLRKLVERFHFAFSCFILIFCCYEF
jgi:hypothetical protein